MCTRQKCGQSRVCGGNYNSGICIGYPVLAGKPPGVPVFGHCCFYNITPTFVPIYCESRADAGSNVQGSSRIGVGIFRASCVKSFPKRFELGELSDPGGFTLPRLPVCGRGGSGGSAVCNYTHPLHTRGPSPVFLLADGRYVHQAVRLGADVHEESELKHLTGCHEEGESDESSRRGMDVCVCVCVCSLASAQTRVFRAHMACT